MILESFQPMMRVPSWWSEDRVAQLKALWDEGILSASHIAAELRTTRNAVLGKAHRLRLGSRMPTSPMKGIPRHQYTRTDKRIRLPPRRPIEEIEAREVAASKATATHNERRESQSLARVKWANLDGPIGVRRGALYRVQPEMTKNQLREVLSRAVRNTAALTPAAEASI